MDRQFTNSALISWRGAQLPGEDIQGYNIYVDGKFTTQVKGSKKTNVVVEDIKPSEVGIVVFSLFVSRCGNRSVPENLTSLFSQVELFI